MSSVAISNIFYWITAVLLLCSVGGCEKKHELHIAVNDGDIIKVKKIINRGNVDINEKNGAGQTVLHLAAYCLVPHGRAPVSTDCLVEIAAFLIDKDANIEARSNSFYTPLHMASMSGNFEVAKLLLTRGADVNAKDGLGENALYMAVYHNQSRKIMSLFIENGVEINEKDNFGDTPLDDAMRRMGDVSDVYGKIVDFLRKHGAKTSAELNGKN